MGVNRERESFFFFSGFSCEAFRFSFFSTLFSFSFLLREKAGVSPPAFQDSLPLLLLFRLSLSLLCHPEEVSSPSHARESKREDDEGDDENGGARSAAPAALAAAVAPFFFFSFVVPCRRPSPASAAAGAFLFYPEERKE